MIEIFIKKYVWRWGGGSRLKNGNPRFFFLPSLPLLYMQISRPGGCLQCFSLLNRDPLLESLDLMPKRWQFISNANCYCVGDIKTNKWNVLFKCNFPINNSFSFLILIINNCQALHYLRGQDGGWELSDSLLANKLERRHGAAMR